jgi:hypothetical protein
MPHLAELQNKYRGQNVQIVSVSDETVDEVKDLLSQMNEEVGKTFADITSAYSLTTDPDGSVRHDYMEAANQEAIPTAFIVGKTGVIEWIGNPLVDPVVDMDEALEAVVNDSWDRDAFKKRLQIQQEFEENVNKVEMLAAAGRFDEAIKIAEDQKTAATDTPIGVEWTRIGNLLKLSGDQVDDEVVGFFRNQLLEIKGDAYAVGRFAYKIYGQAQQGTNVGPLADDSLTAVKAELDGASPDLKPLLYNAVALLNSQAGDFDAAIAAQQAAIDATTDQRMKARLTPLLEELKEKAAGDDPAEASADTPAEASADTPSEASDDTPSETIADE